MTRSSPTWCGRPSDGVSHRLLLLRHAEPVASMRGRCYGDLDVPLSEVGVQQSRRMAHVLAEVPLARVYASPRTRAMDTAKLVCEPHACTPEADERLRELDFGAFEGCTYADIEARFPELFVQWMKDPTSVRFPGGESYADLQARVRSAVRDLVRGRDGEVTLLVAHGGVVRTIVADALGLPAQNIFRLAQDYVGLSCIDDYDGTPVVRVVNWEPA